MCNLLDMHVFDRKEAPSVEKSQSTKIVVAGEIYVIPHTHRKESVHSLSDEGVEKAAK